MRWDIKVKEKPEWGARRWLKKFAFLPVRVYCTEAGVNHLRRVWLEHYYAQQHCDGHRWHNTMLRPKMSYDSPLGDL